MSEHTQGPWLVRTFPTAANARRQLWIVDSIPDQGGQFVGNAICSVSMTNPNAEANASLIAAAPELLESLDNVSAALETLIIQHWLGMSEGDRVQRDKICQEARSLVKKARGK